jgi:hypothetical protein
LTTTKDHYFDSLRSELRKPRHLKSQYRIRKYRRGIRAYDAGFRDGNGDQPAFQGESVVKREQGKTTVKCVKLGGLNHGEARS